MNRKITAIIMVAMFLIGIGTLIYLWWQINSDLAGQTERINDLTKKINQLQKEKIVNEIIYWKIYRNEEYKYEIKYPKDWYLHLRHDQPIFTKKELLPDIGDTEPWAYGEQITIAVMGMVNPFTGVPFTSREKWISWYSESYGEWAKREWVSVNNIKLLKVISSAAGSSYGVLNYFIFEGDKVYAFELYPYVPDDPILPQNIEVLNKMLLTFEWQKGNIQNK